MKTPRSIPSLVLVMTIIMLHSTACSEPTSENSAYQLDLHMAVSEMSALIAEQRAELKEARKQIEALERTVEQMKSQNQETKVAFSLSLETTTDQHTGPFNTGKTLIFKHVFINVGGAYNSHTGFFTAPVRGVYEFSFAALSRGSSVLMSAILRKNRELMVSVYSSFPNQHNNAANGVSLLLEQGDVVDLYLPPHTRVLDNRNHHTTFRGHLLFEVEAPTAGESQYSEESPMLQQ